MAITASGAAAAAGTATGTAPATTYFDTFGATSAGATYQTGATVTGGQLQIVPSTAYPTYRTSSSYALTGSSVTAEFVQVAASSASAETWLIADAGSLGKIMLGVAGGTSTITCRYVVGAGANNDTYIGSYVNATHRHFRIREAAGTVYWETSPDRSTWTVQRSVARPFAVDSVTLALQAGFYTGTDPQPTNALFDNLNAMPGTASGGAAASGTASGAAAATPVAYRASVAGNNAITTNPSTIPFAVPASAQVGDLAVVVFSTNSTTATATAPTPASGAAWSLAANVTAPAASPSEQSWVYTKRLVSGEPGSTVTFTISTGGRLVGVMDFWANATGLETSNSVLDGTNATNVSSWPSAALTTTGSGDFIYNVWDLRLSAVTTQQTITLPGTHTTGAESGTNSATAPQFTVKSGYLPGTQPAGSYGPYTATTTPVGIGIVYTFAVTGAVASQAGTASGTANASGTASAAAPGSASGAAAASGSATGSAAASGSASGSAAASGSASGSAAGTAAGSASASGTGTATASGTAAGTATASGTASASVAGSASGSAAVSGSASSGNLAVGSAVASGTATPSPVAAAATGGASAAGSASGKATVTAAGVLVVNGVATGSVQATATGQLVVFGSATPQVVALTHVYGTSVLTSMSGVAVLVSRSGTAAVVKVSGTAGLTAGSSGLANLNRT